MGKQPRVCKLADFFNTDLRKSLENDLHRIKNQLSELTRIQKETFPRLNFLENLTILKLISQIRQKRPQSCIQQVFPRISSLLWENGRISGVLGVRNTPLLFKTHVEVRENQISATILKNVESSVKEKLADELDLSLKSLKVEKPLGEWLFEHPL